MNNDAAPAKSAHVWLMSHGPDGDHNVYWFGKYSTPKTVVDVLNHYHLPTREEEIAKFLANPAEPNPDIGTRDGQTYYLARHPHHREPG